MNPGLTGWYGLLGIIVVAGALVTTLGVLGAGILKIMLRDNSAK